MRVSGALFLAVLAAAAARAADPPPQGGDSIATAKKDLAAIKAPPGQDPGAALPTLDMKDIGAVPGAALPAMPGTTAEEKEAALDPSKKKQGTGNWLVDAMEKKPEGSRSSRGREKDDNPRGEADLLKQEDKPGAAAEKDAQAPDDARERSGAKEEASAAYNPLDSFMSGWISAKDRDLLLAGAKGEGPAGGDSGRAHTELLPGMDTGVAGSIVDSLAGPADLSSYADSRSAPNPYLSPADLAPAPAARWFLAPEGQGPASGASDFSRGMSSSGVDPRPLDGSRTFIPDFAQPLDDDKYFKQMKRF